VVDAKAVSEMLKTLANKLDMLLRQKLEVELGPPPLPCQSNEAQALY
jgi:hypothetical protein